MPMSNQNTSKLVSFSPSHPDLFKMTILWVVESLELRKQKIDIEDLKGSYQHLRDLDFTSVDDSDAARLIRADFPRLNLYKEIKIWKDHKPIAIQSRWFLLGGNDKFLSKFRKPCTRTNH